MAQPLEVVPVGTTDSRSSGEAPLCCNCERRCWPSYIQIEDQVFCADCYSLLRSDPDVDGSS